jgi:hypothetical protein
MGSTVKRLEVVGEASEWFSGMSAKGEFRCSGCGYGVTVYRTLPDCPMCRSREWTRVPWRPFSRSFAAGDEIVR